MRGRRAHLPAEQQRGDAARLVGAARGAPHAAHVLDAVAREVEEHHVLHLPWLGLGLGPPRAPPAREHGVSHPRGSEVKGHAEKAVGYVFGPGRVE